MVPLTHSLQDDFIAHAIWRIACAISEDLANSLHPHLPSKLWEGPLTSSAIGVIEHRYKAVAYEYSEVNKDPSRSFKCLSLDPNPVLLPTKIGTNPPTVGGACSLTDLRLLRVVTADPGKVFSGPWVTPVLTRITAMEGGAVGDSSA